jgi:DNA modification methylase
MRVERIGKATLYLGDCRDILPTLPRIDAVISDPPYSSGGFQEAGKSSGSIGTRSDETIMLDNLSSRGYQRLMREVLGFLGRCDEAYLFTDWRMWVYTADALEDAGFRVRNMLVWDKCQMGMGLPWRNQHELIAFAKRTPAQRITGKLGNVLRFQRSGNKNHPTEKPVNLMECLLSNSPAESVVDPFMGSGTTGVAAIKTGREFHGIEADPRHFETACQRITEAHAQGDLLAA